ncbi:phage tail tip fiber protein [Neisseria gonorrhoeae]|uniref:phage tail tip fiber protein n=1 Tax=Neisseria gonorrhoeae TaxID=485 RepID=UPI002240021E|nr:DUF1983 domain-containing protein [Neisseria gonorrhoeae]UYP52459.1 DUF1983 domain-containing protein [Neisseria gonorrhoeae]
MRDKINLIDGNGAGSVNERVEAVRSTADGNAAAVQTHAQASTAEAQYTVKVDANGKVAGFGLATTPKNGTPESKFIVNADRFGIGAAGKADVFRSWWTRRKTAWASTANWWSTARRLSIS